MKTIHKGIPFAFYLICSLVGIGTTLILYGFFNRLSLFFGFHTGARIVILMSFFFSLIPGGRIAGRQADKMKRPLVFFAFLCFSVCILVITESVVFDRLYKYYILHSGSGFFGTGIFKFLGSFAIVFIPLSIVGGMLPVLIRSFIRHISYSGRYMSSSILSVSLGAIFGISVMSLLLIPFTGFRVLFLAGGLCYVISGIIALIQKKFKQSENYAAVEIPGRVLRFRKKKPILETGKKLTKAMLYGYSFQAFTFSAMLMISFRILEQYSLLDSSTFLALVLLVVLSGFLVGTSLYRTIAEKPVNKYMTLATFQIITGICALLSYALMMIFARVLAGDATDNLHRSLLLKHTFLFSLFLFLPSLIHGLSFPLAGKLYPKRLQYIGHSFGKLFGLLYISLLSGIILAPYFLIPLLGMHISYFFLSLFVLFSGIFLVFRDSRLIRGYRLSYASAGLLIFIIITVLLRRVDLKHQDQLSKIKAEGSSVSVEVVQNKQKFQSVYVNGHYAFGTDPVSYKEQVLSASLPVFLNKNIQTVLVTGFGTGITPAVLDQLDMAEIQIAEMYPEIIRVSSDVFADENNDIMTGSEVYIFPEDPRSLLSRTDKKFDLITSGINQIHYNWLYNKDFYDLCLNRLTEKGMLCQLLPLKGISAHTFFSICKTASQTFKNISLWYLSPEHVLLLCSSSEMIPDLCQLESSISRVNKSRLSESLNILSGEYMAAHLITTGRDLKKLTASAEIYSDKKPRQPTLKIIEMQPDQPDVISLLKPLSANAILSLTGKTGCQIDLQSKRAQIQKINQSLFQQVSLSYAVPHLPPADFVEATMLPFQKYL